MTKQNCQLYLITPPAISDVQAYARDLSAALEAAPVAALQIRLKDVNDDRVSAITRVIAPLAQARGVAVLMNDHVHLVKPLGLDGVHVGQSDTPYKTARATLGKDAMIGVTCHNSRHLAMDAAEAGADYVAFGAFYPTSTKEVPCVAIGGITADNAAEVAAAGADFIAVSGFVWNHPKGPAFAIDALKTAIDG
jgi:thiamine-phosphate pyrophosphorylase